MRTIRLKKTGVTRKLASLLIAVALILPAIPLSAITAFADENPALLPSSEAVSTYSEQTAEDAVVDTETISGIEDHPLGQSIPISAPNRVYADVSLHGAMVDSYGNVIDNCMNCFEEGADAIEEAE